MSTAVAARPADATEAHVFHSAAEMREIFDSVLSAVNSDERAGALLQATGMRMRVECPDVKATVQIVASDDDGSFIEWRFDRRGGAKPKLVLTMDSEVANEWLQGRESVPMAIAHRRMKCSGEARFALLYLPAMKLIAGPYRRLVKARYPHLAL